MTDLAAFDEDEDMDAWVERCSEPNGTAIELRAGKFSSIPSETSANDALSEPTRLKRVDVSDISTAEIAAPQFIVDPWVVRDHITLLTGHGGAGKSGGAITLTAHAACGQNWAGLPITQCRAVYVSLEDPGELVRFRLRRIADAYALPPEVLAENLTVLDGSDIDATLVAESNERGIKHLVETPLFRELEEAVSGYGFIVIDNASDAFGADENQRRHVRGFMRRLAKIARQNHAAVVLLAHLDKAGARNGTQGNSYSGSTAWHNSARSRIALLTEGESLVLRHEKSNLSALAEPITLEWHEGVLMPAARDRVSEQMHRERQASEDAEDVLEVVRVALAMGITIPAALAGPAQAYHALEPLPELDDRFRGAKGRKRVGAAITHLLREDRLKKVTYTASHRNKRERLELTQTRGIGVSE